MSNEKVHRKHLPIDWEEWCEAAGLSLDDEDGYYLRGYGRYWRVNCYGEFQCGDKYKDFDGWARSKRTSEYLPAKRDMFLRLVPRLIAEHNVDAKG